MKYTTNKGSWLVGTGRAFLSPAESDFTYFRQVMRQEREHGFHSTFFFNAQPLLSRQRAHVDILYDISHRNFQPLFRELKDQGFEIGLHASYHAYRSADHFVVQKHRLEAIAGAAVKGLRHHYWHVGPDVGRTLAYHEAAGFLYDTSLSFDDELGFRRSTSLPYAPWSSLFNRPLNVLQLPVFCMDGHTFYTPA